MAEPMHPTDALHDAIDGRLDASARARLDLHLATCDDCRRELTAMRWTKTQLSRVGQTEDTSVEFETAIREAMDAVDRETNGVVETSQAPTGDRRIPRRYWLSAAAAVLGIAAVTKLLWIRPAPARAADDFRLMVADPVALPVRTSDPAALELRLRNEGLPFTVRVFDFGMMNYTLTGGGRHRFGDEASAIFAYHGGDGRALVCQMYRGTVRDLPAPAERRTNDGIDFLVYREGELTVVFWQEGDVVCVLVADGDPEAAVRLAFAKAVRV